MKQGEAGTNPGFFPASGAEKGTVLKYLRGVGPRRAEGLARLGLLTVDDLLHHVPRRYEDRRSLCRIEEAVVGKTQVLHGEIESVRERSLGGRRSLIEARMVDAEGAAGARGAMDLVWFNQPYIIEWLQPGCRLHVYGQVKLHRGRLQMPAPEFELDAEPEQSECGASPHIQRIVPVYPLAKGVHQRFLRGLVFRILEEDLANLGTGRPGSPYDQFHPDAPPLLEAYRRLHFPDDWKDIESAKARFVFDERFVFASQLIFRRLLCREGGGAPFAVTADLDRKIRSVFPFQLTADQDRAIAEITQDLEGPSPMYRLLQGDVGTGKTAVALYAMLAAVRNGHQAALMAPTEVLAVQHHRTISKALERHPVRTSLLTGSLRPSERRAASEAIASGKSHIVIGTHALCQESVTFRKLGLVVIDEQHRFGVRERMRLRKKGKHPHVLVMTATPIPRSLCLTCYGDLDFSLLKERPRGRPPVKTYLVSGKKRAAAMEFIRKELAAGRQAFFVYPLIDESEALALPAARRAHEVLSKEVFPEYRVALLHGQMPPAEKDRELEDFRQGRSHILVATVVVEVGIDVPGATVLFIEDASRFGLAQLHQLRGRVGRGEHAGSCLVGLVSASREVLRRLEVFASTEDGFRLAEEDLKLRGPGDYLGVRQSGRPHFLLGNPLEDLPGFLEVKRLAGEFWGRVENAPYRERWKDLLGTEEDAEMPSRKEFLGMD